MTLLPHLPLRAELPLSNSTDAFADQSIQTVLIVPLDAFGVRGRRPLTFHEESLTFVIEGADVEAVLECRDEHAPAPGPCRVAPLPRHRAHRPRRQILTCLRLQ